MYISVLFSLLAFASRFYVVGCVCGWGRGVVRYTDVMHVWKKQIQVYARPNCNGHQHQQTNLTPGDLSCNVCSHVGFVRGMSWTHASTETTNQQKLTRYNSLTSEIMFIF